MDAYIGQIVHYVLPPASQNPGVCRPAIVLENEDGVLLLHAFTNHLKDGARYGTITATGVPHGHGVDTWHMFGECSKLKGDKQ